MELIRDLSACPSPSEGCVVTIGNFDGMHLGHQAIVNQASRLATSTGAREAIVTFDRHPVETLRPEKAPCRLTSARKKLTLLTNAGVDYVAMLTFDHDRADQEADDFVREVLVDCLHTRTVVVGSDFRFGRNRKGDTALLKGMGAELGFDVVPHELITFGETTISSTRVRHAITEGEVSWAALALGRDHSIEGSVVRGDQRGRTLGFPTANVALEVNFCVPADGVYAGWGVVAGARRPAAINVGKRPTFGKHDDSLVEVHFLDFEGDIYGDEIEVGFTERVRGEYRFSGADELAVQIANDVDAVRRVMRA